MSYMPPIFCDHCRDVLGNKIEAWALMRPTDDHSEKNSDGRTAMEIFGNLVEKFFKK